MNQLTMRLDSRTGSPGSTQGRSRRGPVQMATLSTIGGWMTLIAVLAILLAVATEFARGSGTSLMILVSLILVVLPSRTHLRLAFGSNVKSKYIGSLQTASHDPSRVVSKSSLSDEK